MMEALAWLVVWIGFAFGIGLAVYLLTTPRGL
jgi:hypothetical protein